MDREDEKEDCSKEGFFQITCLNEGCDQLLLEVADEALNNPVLARLCEKCEGPLKMLSIKQAENASAPLHHYLRCENCAKQFRMDIFPIKVHCPGCNDGITIHPNWCLHKRELN